MGGNYCWQWRVLDCDSGQYKDKIIDVRYDRSPVVLVVGS